jgi:hypothetical protein
VPPRRQRGHGGGYPSKPESSDEEEEEEEEGEEGKVNHAPLSPLRDTLPSLSDILSRQVGGSSQCTPAETGPDRD